LFVRVSEFSTCAKMRGVWLITRLEMTRIIINVDVGPPWIAWSVNWESLVVITDGEKIASRSHFIWSGLRMKRRAFLTEGIVLKKQATLTGGPIIQQKKWMGWSSPRNNYARTASPAITPRR
jgi:hypothetical protein